MAAADLGRLIKQKHPGAYDDLSDDELGQRTLQKYPQYADIAGSPSAPPADTRSRGEKILGAVEGVARGITNFSGTTKLAENLGKAVGTRSGTPNLRESIGSGLQGAATIGSLGLAAPAALGVRAAQGAGIGATTALGSSLEREGNVGANAKSAAIGAALGAILPVGLEKGAGAGKKALVGSAETIYNKLVKTPARQVAAGKSKIGTGLLERGVRGSNDDMARQVTTAVTKSREQLDDVIGQRADTPIDTSSVVSALKDLQAQLKKTPGESSHGADEVLKFFKGKQTLTAVEAQELKRNLQRAVNDAFLRQNTTGATQAQKVAAQKLRVAIEQAVPEVKPLNREIEFGIRAADQLIKNANASPSKLRLITEVAIGGYGAIANPALLAAIGAERVITTPQTATRLAQGAYKAGKKQIDSRTNSVVERLLTTLASRGR